MITQFVLEIVCGTIAFNLYTTMFKLMSQYKLSNYWIWLYIINGINLQIVSTYINYDTAELMHIQHPQFHICNGIQNVFPYRNVLFAMVYKTYLLY